MDASSVPAPSPPQPHHLPPLHSHRTKAPTSLPTQTLIPPHLPPPPPPLPPHPPQPRLPRPPPRIPILHCAPIPATPKSGFFGFVPGAGAGPPYLLVATRPVARWLVAQAVEALRGGFGRAVEGGEEVVEEGVGHVCLGRGWDEWGWGWNEG